MAERVRSVNGGSAFDHCRALVADADEDFHLSIPYAPAVDRARLAAIFAFLIELRRVPHVVSEPPLGEMRLQWWRDAISAIFEGRPPHGHPVLEALEQSVAVTEGFRAAADRMIDARARLLYQPSFSSLDDLRGFLANAEAPIVTLALGPRADGTAEKAAEAYALARFAPVIAPSLAEEAAMAAAKTFASCSGDLRRLGVMEGGQIAFLALTSGYAARPHGGNWPLGKRLTLFRAVLTGRF